jgi:NADPH-dependent curcumin reductase CurA
LSDRSCLSREALLTIWLPILREERSVRMPAKNRQILLASRPKGEPTVENFKLVESEIPSPGPGQMLLRTIYLSLDPYMRGRMNAGKSYARPVEVGEVMRASARRGGRIETDRL